MKHFYSLPQALPVAAALLCSFAAGAITFTTDTYIGAGNTTYDNMNIVISNCTLTIDGLHPFASLQVLSGGNVTHSFFASGGSGLNLTIGGDATVTAGGAINVSGRGFDGAVGPGAGKSSGSPLSGSGAGHGGYGGQSGALDGSGITYGSITQPTMAGSGGGRGYGGVGGAGGGFVKLAVGGTLRVDGSISANGADGINVRSGGGSGGAVWLSAQTFTGAGSVSANGGSGEPGQGGGGGGGRISLQSASNSFHGTMSAHGGGGYVAGGAGTIYSLTTGQTIGQLLIDNAGQSGTNTPVSLAEISDLTVQNGAVVGPTVAGSFHNLLIASNAWLSAGAQYPINVSGNATVQEGGGIIADGAGYTSNLGPGAGKYAVSTYAYTGGGGGYGGFGATGGATNAYGGVTYGSVTSPMDLGSGGGASPTVIFSPTWGAGAGGGMIRLNVTGMLFLEGRISANGTAGLAEGSGGGSGGSILLTLGTLAGGGAISADGGAGNGTGLWSGGGGGGGRIGINYGLNLFFGVTSARGGSGAGNGGAGTIHSKANNQSWGEVVMDNGGLFGTNTTLGSLSVNTVDLNVRGGAVFTPPATLNFGALRVGAGGSMIISNQPLNGQGNVFVESGGAIRADGTGYSSGQGPGAGRYSSGTYGYTGGGGGYGGYGGNGYGGFYYPGPVIYGAGGTTYGSVTSPTELGSGGGGYLSAAPGGSGGGAVRLTTKGLVRVDGTISAAGVAGGSQNAGGGSGGTISLFAGILAGSGIISANGGAGSFQGGGGGGGRVSVLYTTNVFSGVISTYGGGGYIAGGAGTIYMKPTSQSSGLVILDNGGQSGTNTSWGASSGTVDLTIKGGAIFAPTYYTVPAIGTLLVASNGWLLLASSSYYSAPSLTVQNNATVQAGGGILGDGTGSAGGQGSGAGKYANADVGYVSGGGGHGGSGATSGGAKTGAGGSTYDSLTAPTMAGSGGGTYSTYVLGGAGGANVRLNVNGTLLVDGRISANGNPGASANAGGGSGGSIWLTAGTLAGSGIIAANGGMGVGLGGGGGGGRIALQYTANSFSGTVSAYGGDGYARGGAGTVYSKASREPWGQLIVDNDGQAGTNTSWLPSGTLDLIVKGGAVVSPPSSQTFGNLLIRPGGWLSLSNQVVTVSSNAIIEAGGGVTADGTGYAGNEGPGAGKYLATSGSAAGGGGGYGGYGANGGGTSRAMGGNAYGLAIEPVDRGSGGGGIPTFSPGGSGGGAVRMTVNGALVVNGRVSANGNAGSGQGTGGGSGGGIWLTVGTWSGTGIISANGGPGDELGGGGGGGRISIQYGVNTFEGSLSAYGGGGSSWGGAGTIYTKPKLLAMGLISLDNAGHVGTNTPLSNLPPFELSIKGAAIGVPASTFLTLSNLTIGTRGSLTSLPGQTNLNIAVLRDATIEHGGSISLDGKGFAAGAGPGAGQSTNYIGSGAGYGGDGGASSVLPGGTAYGSAQQPVDRGSGGGLGLGASTPGSEGGGALRLTVGGTLMVHGRITACGNAGLQDNSGGGSGGSLWLTAGALAGSGVIAADGGGGELYQGGGGGGGRVAIYTSINAFGGAVSATGGNGASAGQAGSIYYGSSLAGPQVVSCTPVGTVTNAVSSAEVVFDTPVDPYSVSASTLGITTPAGLAVSNLAIAAVSPCCFQVTFPPQAAPGDYVIEVGPQVHDLFGNSMSQAYTGTFAIEWAPMALTSRLETNGYRVSWYGTSGVSYQPMYSTDLVTWLPFAGPIQGTDGPLDVLVPLGTAARMYFRLEAGY